MKLFLIICLLFPSAHAMNNLDQQLVQAIQDNNVPLMEQLLDAGANPNAKDFESNTPIYYTLGRNNIEAIRVLVEAGANPNAVNEDQGYTPLHVAAENDLIEVIKELLAAGANPNAVNKRNETPLHHAVHGDSTQTVQVLLNGGANPSMRDDKGNTPLDDALKWYKLKLKTATILLEAVVRLRDTHLVEKLLPKLPLTLVELHHYNQLLKKLYQQTDNLTYKQMGTEFRAHALKHALAKRAAQEIAHTHNVTLPQELAAQVATYAQGKQKANYT
ncbi:ankyrin repeat domain-containing protein [Candidatus Dependentiae bacterium]|nr:ankyrin repeat domain-containing protein [Candidatus Dependentiae bacterium]